MLWDDVTLAVGLTDTVADAEGGDDGDGDGVTARMIDFFPIGGSGDPTYAFV